MTVTQGCAQNWRIDPYGLHEARWFSQGFPTALVRDGAVESQDPPPDWAAGDRYGSGLAIPPPSCPAVPGDDRHRHRRWPALSRARRR